MPLKQMTLKLARKLVCMDPQEQEEAVPEAIPPELEPDEAQSMEPGPPYQDYVESEVRRYWQEIGNVHNLTKPTREELRRAAMPILCLALRNRPGYRRHQAIAAMVQHAFERDWIKIPFSEANESPTYVEALVELARDARWSAQLELTRNTIIYYIINKIMNNLFKTLNLEGFIEKVQTANSTNILCGHYNQLAGIERQEERDMRGRDRAAFSTAELETMPKDTASPTFVLGEKQNLDAEALENEIKHYLRAFCHPFISQAVNDIEFGRGIPVAGHPGLLQVTAGIHRLGNCNVFYHIKEGRQLVRIVGIGFHLGRGNYRLEYATGELAGSGRILRLS